MDPNLILEIIKLSLYLALQIVKDMPDAQKQKFWEDHAKRQLFWEDLLNESTPAKS